MIHTTAIIGMGALGLLYADVIAKKMGNEAVSFIMDQERLEKNKGKIFTCNGVKKEFTMKDAGQMHPVDLVIVAVKYSGLQSAVESMKNCIGENTVIMSVMNGIDSEEIIGKTYGAQHMIYTVAQGMDAMKFGDELSYTKMGELRIGSLGETQKKNLEQVAAFFDYIAMPYAVEEDILHRLWGKFMLNVGVNQTCMAYETTYSGALKEGSVENSTMNGAMQEVIALANAKGIALSDEDRKYYINILKTLAPDGMPSMRQDGVAHRKTEVEMFAGTVMRMSKEYGLKTPVNDSLYNKIRKMEEGYLLFEKRQ